MPSSPSSSRSTFITAQRRRIIQNLCVFLAKVFEAVKSPLEKGDGFEKHVNIFYENNLLNLSFIPLFFIFLFPLSHFTSGHISI